jgi:anti-sigma factor RsiW
MRSSHDIERLMARLLGPAEAEVGCTECFEDLHSYVELELSGADPEAAFPGVRAHLEGCPACAEDHDSLRAFLLRG